MYVLHQRDRGSNGGDMLEVERIVAVERQMILLGATSLVAPGLEE